MALTLSTSLLDDLRDANSGEVDATPRRRAEYSTDASNYRLLPQVVVFPRTRSDVVSILEVARSHAVPITSRGGGTSIAGNSIGEGIVIDFSRHMNAILEFDPVNRLARVEPGVVMSDLQALAAPHGLRFGPDPSTQNRATFGGMIGNNACGPRAVAYGRTADNTVSLEVIDGRGREFTAGKGLGPVAGLDDLVQASLATIRTEFGRFSRQVSGYSLEHLLPENKKDLAKFLVGTEGTLVTVTEATLALVEVPSSPTLVVLGYPTMAEAADAVPAMLEHRPVAIEGFDAQLVEAVRAQGGSAIPELPDGAGWLFVEVAGETEAAAHARARELAADAGTTAVRIIPAGPEAAALWRIRADGAGLAGRTAEGNQAWPGWEDAAVPPEALGAYLRELEDLMASYRVTGMPYGHFGDGCIHLRIDFPLGAGETAYGPEVFREFMFDAGRLVAKYGGSASGEHGDGRARSELLPLQYSPEAIEIFGGLKHLFDPRNLLNPGVLVEPDPLDAHLRRPRALPIRPVGGFSFRHDDGDFTGAVHRCVGVGKCRADNSAAGGFMCPSYQATKDEKDTTRGRARILQEVTSGDLHWSDPAVADSLDLCLSCKACSTDCPAGVDMAQYKSEVLYRKHKGKLRPISHYSLGWLPRWGKAITAIPGVAALANAALRFRPLARLVLAGGGMDTRRHMVAFNHSPFHRWARTRARIATASQIAGSGGAAGAGTAATAGTVPTGKTIVLWADPFSEYLDDSGARATLELLTTAGFDVVLPPVQVSAALTWITTGQLDIAKRELRKTLDVLAPYAAAGIPIIGVEPSEIAAIRSDLVDLLGEDSRAGELAGGVFTLAEVLTGEAARSAHLREPGGDRAVPPDFPMPDLRGRTVIVQPHCHQYSVMGYAADRALIKRTGADVVELAGCCGMAGNFGMEKGHYEVSAAVAETALLPSLRDAPEGAIFLADGYSCRTQADDLAGVQGLTLAELLRGDAREA